VEEREGEREREREREIEKERERELCTLPPFTRLMGKRERVCEKRN
jgi:hypothetical protein